MYVSAPSSHSLCSLRHLSVLSLRFSPTVSPTRSLDSPPLISSLIFVIARRRHGAVAPSLLPDASNPKSGEAPTCTRSLSTSTRSSFHGRTPSLRAHRATRLDCRGLGRNTQLSYQAGFKPLMKSGEKTSDMQARAYSIRCGLGVVYRAQLTSVPQVA